MSTITFKLQEIPHVEGTEMCGYYPVLAHSNKISASELCKMIQERCTVTEGDALAVLNAVAQIMGQELANGVQVELPDIGTFSPSLASDRRIMDTTDKQLAHYLRVDNIKFYPKATLKNCFRGVSFRRANDLVRSLSKLTDEEVVCRIHSFYQKRPNEVMDRTVFQSITGLRRTKAIEVLSRLVEQGLLVKKGRWNAPYYVLPEDDTSE